MLQRLLFVLLLSAAFAQAETLKQAIDGYVLAAEQQGPPSKPWVITGTLGLTITDGNSETITLTVGIDATKEWDKLKLILRERSIYAEDQSVQSANEHILTERLEYTLSDISWLTQTLILEHDDEEKLKYRVIFTLGYKRQLVKKKNFELFGEVGGGVQHDEFRTTSNTEAIAQLGIVFKWQITEALLFEHKTFIFPSLSEGGEFFLVSESTFSTPISDRMKLNLSIIDTYDSDAIAPTKKNDLKVVLTLSIDFTKKPE